MQELYERVSFDVMYGRRKERTKDTAHMRFTSVIVDPVVCDTNASFSDLYEVFMVRTLYG